MFLNTGNPNKSETETLFVHVLKQRRIENLLLTNAEVFLFRIYLDFQCLETPVSENITNQMMNIPSKMSLCSNPNT